MPTLCNDNETEEFNLRIQDRRQDRSNFSTVSGRYQYLGCQHILVSRSAHLSAEFTNMSLSIIG